MPKSDKENTSKDNYIESNTYPNPNPRHAGYCCLGEHTLAGNGPARTFLGASTPEPSAHLRLVSNGLTGLQVKLEFEALKRRNIYILMVLLKASPLVIDTIRYLLPYCQNDFNTLYDDKARPEITYTITANEKSDEAYDIEFDGDSDDENALGYR